MMNIVRYCIPRAVWWKNKKCQHTIHSNRTLTFFYLLKINYSLFFRFIIPVFFFILVFEIIISIVLIFIFKIFILTHILKFLLKF